jgi:hypothetical protein
MRHLDRIKRWGNISDHILVLDEKNFTDDQIMTTLEISKQTIYNARKAYEPLSEALKTINDNSQVDKRNPDIQEIIDAFTENFGTTKSTRWDRYAAKRLSDKYGADRIVKVIQILAAHGGEPYVPSVGSVRELEEKLVKVQSFFKRLQANSEVVEL